MAMVDSGAVVVVIVFLVHTMVVLYDEVLVVFLVVDVTVVVGDAI